MYLYGASGHAKVVMDVLAAQGIEIDGLIDDNPDVNELGGHTVEHSAEGKSPIIVTIGDCNIRRRIVEKLNCEFGTAIHPTALISPSAVVGEGSVVMHSAIIQAGASVGRHCIVNTRASIDHECRIGDYVHIAPGVLLSGNVHVGDESWIGIGTCIKQGVKVGKNCIIGAGSVVVKDIPDNAIAYCNPCCVTRFKE